MAYPYIPVDGFIKKHKSLIRFLSHGGGTCSIVEVKRVDVPLFKRSFEERRIILITVRSGQSTSYSNKNYDTRNYLAKPRFSINRPLFYA